MKLEYEIPYDVVDVFIARNYQLFVGYMLKIWSIFNPFGWSVLKFKMRWKLYYLGDAIYFSFVLSRLLNLAYGTPAITFASVTRLMTAALAS